MTDALLLAQIASKFSGRFVQSSFMSQREVEIAEMLHRHGYLNENNEGKYELTMASSLLLAE